MKKKKTVTHRAENAPTLFQEFILFLREHKGLSEGTIHNRKGPLLDFFRLQRIRIKSDAKKLTSRSVQRYVRKTARSLTVEKKKAMLTALRTFFRFLYFKSYQAQDLSRSVPNVVTYSQARVPKGLSIDLARKLLRVPDQRRAIGRRDYAVLLLFLKYGVRSKQVTDLLLKDIKWREGTIYFRPMKGGKPVLVPMDAEVAKALLGYIKKDRRDTTYPHVFVKHQTGPARGQPLGRALWFMVSRYLEKAGLPAGHRCRGPHSLRHTVATELLRKKHPLKTISDLLGHRSMSTTMIYTKVDLVQMRELEQPWPTVEAA